MLSYVGSTELNPTLYKHKNIT